MADDAFTANDIAKIIENEINELTEDDLIRADEEGARIYLLTGSGGKPYLHISFGDPIDSAMHEWADGLTGPKACDQGWECWQEEKRPPVALRDLMHQNLKNTLIDEYLRSTDYVD